VNLSVCHLPPNVVVPSVVLLSEGSARVTLITKGLAVGTVTTVANCAVAKGTVLSQSPAARVTVALGRRWT
jgi:beta-lactam-binding protein with PASTA domain